MNQFLLQSELSLNKAGYLIGKKEMPVNNESYVEAQSKAHFIVSLANAIKGKNFKAGKIDNLDSIIAEVRAAIGNSNQTYGTAPVKPTSAVNDEMVKFALDFDKFKTEESKFGKFNEFMNQFNAINDVESVGDYFSEGVVKLKAIYTIAQITEAVQSNIDVLAGC